ncbi:chromatin accessibility complex protein 1 [Lepeophtheirus salmonis]|uniref:Chromatin accessibility complex protein 1 n=1 Tax=Lepeophtheirus salmonis TaxID=72036 RepID=D3PIP7_LEPSM|nr:chromatin accessibility complex protein 1-like isoform X1 [Lepeophtheirus salmonis]ADD38433.1 Chromatin accessibility complex protein 1 [Lepeophtheirus salmonis]
MTRNLDVKNTNLPLTRVRRIMKSSPDVGNISRETLYLITKATEKFISFLANDSLCNGPNKSQIEYEDLVNTVQNQRSLEFLRFILPKKMKFSEYLDMLGREGSPEKVEEFI